MGTVLVAGTGDVSFCPVRPYVFRKAPKSVTADIVEVRLNAKEKKNL